MTLHPRLKEIMGMGPKVCDGCGGVMAEPLECAYCGELFCKGCIDKCGMCHDWVCMKDQYLCHDSSCQNDPLCNGCIFTCDGCEQDFCSEHIGECDNCYGYICDECNEGHANTCLEKEEGSMSTAYAAATTAAARRGQTEVGGSIYCKGEPYEITDIREDRYGEVYTVEKGPKRYEVRRNLHPLKGSSMGHWTRFRYSCQCVGWRYNRHCKHTQGLAQALGERQSYSAVETSAETVSRWLPVEGAGLAKTLGLALIGGALVYALVTLK